MKKQQYKEVKMSELLSFFPKQKEALEAVKEYKFVLYGGAMGGGKSRWLRWMAVYLLISYASRGLKNVRIGLFCEDYPSLNDRQINKVEIEFPEWLGTMNKGSHEFILAPQYGSGVICFRNLDDPNKYKSAEFASILIDELTMSLEDKFNILRTRLRWPGIVDVKFIAATNPGGVGHAWVMKRWMLKEFPIEETESEQFFYVPSTAKDNPFLDKSYYHQLEGLPEDMRKAYVDGDWNLFAGQYFSEFRTDRHVIDPFKIPDEWFRYRSSDFGRTAPFCCKWYAVDYDGNVYAYREYYKAGIEAEDNFKNVQALSENELYRWSVLDSSCFSSYAGASFNKGSGETIADIAWKNGYQAIPSPKNRLHGWALMHQYLNWKTIKDGKIEGEKIPKLRYFKTCADSIRSIPSLIHDKNNVEDLDTKGEDHAADCDSYFLQTLHQGNTPSSQTRPKTMLERMAERQNTNNKGFVEDTFTL